MRSPASLRIVVLLHEPETGLGAFAAVLDQAHVDYEIVETLRGPLPDPTAFDGAIALGGSLRASDPRLLKTRRWIRNGVLRALPFLGVCLGGQLLASALGAPVERQARPQLGVHDVYLTEAGHRDPLFSGLPGRLAVFGWHEDRFELPGAVPLGLDRLHERGLPLRLRRLRLAVPSRGPRGRACELGACAWLPRAAGRR